MFLNLCAFYIHLLLNIQILELAEKGPDFFKSPDDFAPHVEVNKTNAKEKHRKKSRLERKQEFFDQVSSFIFPENHYNKDTMDH